MVNKLFVNTSDFLIFVKIFPEQEIRKNSVATWNVSATIIEVMLWLEVIV